MIDRKVHWQNVYKDKSPLEVSWYQKKPKLSLELIDDSDLESSDAIIDVGGGASVFVDHLHKKKFTNISVLDISNAALSSAKKRLGSSAKNIEWLESDITEFRPPQKYALWHDRAVFHFLTSRQDRQMYLMVLNESLKLNGFLILAAFAIGGPKQCSGLDIVQYDLKKLVIELGDNFRLVDERVENHVTPSGKGQAFNYFRFIKFR